jgi:capsular exopolysaccharide synthesis family protein
MPQGADDASLRHQLGILRRRWFVVVLLAVLGGGAAAVLTLGRQPEYQAVASVRVPTLSDEELVAGDAVESQRTVATEVEVLRSTRDALVGTLGAGVKVVVERRSLSDVVDVRATSGTRSGAVDAATKFAEEYVDRRISQRVDAVDTAQEQVKEKIAEVTTQPDELTSLQGQLGRLDDAALATASAAEVVSRAERADRVSPSPLRNGALGLGGGLILGLGLASILDKVDDRLRRREDLEAAVDLPVLGVLPRVSRRQLDQGVLAVLAPGSPSDEAYRTLRTNLRLLTGGRAIRCLQVTSPTSNEGKTTVVTTLAASFAQAGQRVIVVDCDLRQPRVHEAFGLPDEGGLSSVLLGERALADAITTLDDQPRMVVLTAGPVPPNPTDLLASERAGAVLATLRANCDILLIDAPSVLPFPDARIVSRHVDAVLLVARPMRSTRREVARAHQLLSQVGAPTAGTVLSAVLPDAGAHMAAGPSAGARPERRKKRQRPARTPEGGTVELSRDLKEEVPH